jgi:alkyldihydroxyacetonephosphate synthase
MLLGSEGILGIITRAWMRVRPRPRFKSSATVRFANFTAGVEAARAVAQSGLFPSNCRLLDAREAQLNMVDQHTVLLLGFESADRAQVAPMQAAIALAEAAGGTLTRPATHSDAQAPKRDKTAGSWRNAFMTGPYLQSTLMMLGLVVDTFETCCTWSAFPALDAAVRAAVRDAMGDRPGRISCRFTHVYPDGPAPYYTWMTPMAADVPAQWRRIKAAASDALIAHGATITHHHAVGRTHRRWYEKQRPAPFGKALRALKGVCDPAGRLNPGVLIEE